MGTFLDYLNEIEKNPNFFKQKKVVTESSLSRLWKHHIEHPCGTISAFRNEYTKQENFERTEQLRLRIGVCGYSFTKIQGKYIETNDDGTKKMFQKFHLLYMIYLIKRIVYSKSS